MLLAGLRAWLERSPVAEDEPAALSSCSESPAEPLSSPTLADLAWPRSRLDFAAKLWGEGFILPGGEQEVLRLARPLGVSPASSLLLLGSGPGGAARSIAVQLGGWVNGFEADPQLAAAGAELCTRAGVGKRAQVEAWNPADPQLAHRSYHHALALEAMRVGPPETVLGALALALRRDGQLALIEAVKLSNSDDGFADWMRLERRVTPVPAEASISRLLSRLGFEIRVVEDISPRHMSQALQGWRDAVHNLSGERPSPGQAAVIVREAELWWARIRLMRTGRLRLMRWHAIRRAPA